MKLTLDKFNLLPPDVQKEFLEAATLAKQKRGIEKAQTDFMSFVKRVWPEFIEGSHHKKIAEKFNDIANGKIKRLIINMPPRHTKSEFASFLLPAWMIGRRPKLKIIQSTHTTELAVRFGRKAKTLMDMPEYKEIFPTSFSFKIAESIAKFSLMSVYAAKKAIKMSQETGLFSGLKTEKYIFEALFNTMDKKSGVEAFLNKKPASFEDK